MAIGTVGFSRPCAYIARPPWRRLAALVAIAGPCRWRTKCSGWATTACSCPTPPWRRTLRAAPPSGIRLSRDSPRLTGCGFRCLSCSSSSPHGRDLSGPMPSAAPPRWAAAAHGVVCHRDRRRLHARADAAAGDVRAAAARHAGAGTGAEAESRARNTRSSALLCGHYRRLGDGRRAQVRDPRHWASSRRSGIADERGWWTVFTGQQHRTTRRSTCWRAWAPRSAAARSGWSAGTRAPARAVLLYYPGTASSYTRLRCSSYVRFPLNGPGIGRHHLQPSGHRRRGHAASRTCRGRAWPSYALGSIWSAIRTAGRHPWVIPAWIVAEYSNVTQAPGIPAAQLAAARKALSCGQAGRADQATQAR